MSQACVLTSSSLCLFLFLIFIDVQCVFTLFPLFLGFRLPLFWLQVPCNSADFCKVSPRLLLIKSV